uniref:Putative dehydrogenase n=1 Tax=Xenopsylla cheopis TaxID=163159 RepID=A0A6M2DFL0_XENCH
MDRWCGKVAVVTGASAGIGAALAKSLVEAGMKVVGLARRIEKMENEAHLLDKSNGGEFYPVKCDISKEQDILDAFAWVKETFGGVDVLINNAGVTRNINLTDPDNSDDIRNIVDVNIFGVFYCTREAFNSMKERGVAGHIIHINSVLGHYVPELPGFNLNIYPGTKYCMTASTEVLRKEMIKMGNKSKVTSISPGFVATEMMGIKSEEEKQAFLDATPHLLPEDISQAVLYCLGTPEHVQVHELIIRPQGENF